MAMFFGAPSAAADATASLRTQVDALRGTCPPFQLDPVLNDLALRANTETTAYKEHTARFIPFEDPLPVLHEMGYQAGKAKLHVGYGDSADKAILGVTIFGWETLPDCTYTRYGLNVMDHADRGYVLAALVLAGD
ncbi:hypothetical protein [Mycobacterium kyogaense]|uniref:hypothetical protein n=1 Tax=Mycobacterium kyogaense TaxID=2212479 RepID=UPI000DAC9C12|nr:hypothetical protein [Mycobacterium kyogaense]